MSGEDYSQYDDPALGNYGERATTPGQRVDRRTERHRLKVTQRALTKSRSSAMCFFPLSGIVSVSIGRKGIAFVSGVSHCGSPHACPICAPVVRERRAGEIREGMSALLDAGGSALFVTATGPHHLGDPLEPLLDVMSRCVHSWTQGRTWGEFRQRLGYIGSIRAIDITYGSLASGRSNGWHPHCHALLCFESVLREQDWLDLWLHCERAHQRALTAAGFGAINAHGVQVLPVRGGDALSTYLAKVEGGWSVGHELARGDVKKGGATPFDLLRRCVEGEASDIRLWREYEAATFNKRFLVWGPGLRQKLLTTAEVSDVEAAAAEGEDDAVVRFEVEAAVWLAYCRAGQIGGVLAALEAMAFERFRDEMAAAGVVVVRA